MTPEEVRDALLELVTDSVARGEQDDVITAEPIDGPPDTMLGLEFKDGSRFFVTVSPV